METKQRLRVGIATLLALELLVPGIALYPGLRPTVYDATKAMLAAINP